jgi:hypothetical protein
VNRIFTVCLETGILTVLFPKQKKGWKLISEIKNQIDINWQQENFDKTVDDFISLFDSQFFDDLKFLIYFQGKDFAKALTNKLSEFPLKTYCQFANKHFNYEVFEDLIQLRKLIETQK